MTQWYVYVCISFFRKRQRKGIKLSTWVHHVNVPDSAKQSNSMQSRCNPFTHSLSDGLVATNFIVCLAFSKADHLYTLLSLPSVLQSNWGWSWTPTNINLLISIWQLQLITSPRWSELQSPVLRRCGSSRGSLRFGSISASRTAFESEPSLSCMIISHFPVGWPVGGNAAFDPERSSVRSPFQFPWAGHLTSTLSSTRISLDRLSSVH